MNNKRLLMTAVSGAYVLVLALTAQADPIIYLQPPDETDGLVSGRTRSDFDMYGPGRFSNQVLDDFVLEWAGEGALYELTDIHWWGTYVGQELGESGDDFTVRIFEDGETPQLIEEFTPTWDLVNRADSGYDIPFGQRTRDVWSYWFDLAEPLYLDPESTYYISVINNTPSDSTDWAWVYGMDGNGQSWMRVTDESPWEDWSRHDMAFALTGSVVPEPATLTLLGLGVAGLLIKNRRRAGKS